MTRVDAYTDIPYAELVARYGAHAQVIWQAEPLPNGQAFTLFEHESHPALRTILEDDPRVHVLSPVGAISDHAVAALGEHLHVGAGATLRDVRAAVYARNRDPRFHPDN